MSTLEVSSVGENLSNCVNSVKNKNNDIQTNSFEKKVEEFANSNSLNSIGVKSQDGMVISQPPNYWIYTDSSNTISNKSKANMTMDEYKQYFANEMSKIPVSSYYRASFTGSLVITEKAFEKMKSDPKWEKTVLNMVREMYSVNGLPQRSYCMQVIGASPEETYGYTVPLDNKGSGIFGASENKKSWWQRRHEKMEKLEKEHDRKQLEQQTQAAQAYEKCVDLNNYDMSQFMILNAMKTKIISRQVPSQLKLTDFISQVSEVL
ncbi:hypothetical protein CcarbDRAFT_1833 [Clostridium carboxidivorans P7]|uniref:Uncharacterized protein n=1 Tax=Clostridium carboxidivorans P7 TaxID=536227 RepID=C6PSR6_9CLOT|nr:hypothetical protein [Clostridium carboxidivorans]EET87745.1 hypothetical protein CcarbDRAFT_1833 [Clostridium carboxidivorans P7]